MNLVEHALNSPSPDLSVILMVDRQRERGTESLQALLAQSIIDRIEIVLVDFSDAAPLAGSDHPSVCMHRMPRGMGFGAARAEGVKLARGPIIAFVEEHVQVIAGWAEAIVAAHRDPYPAIGGENHIANPEEGISTAIAMMNYFRWLPPITRKEVTILDGHNATYKRSALDAYADNLPAWLDCEIVLYEHMTRDGTKLLVDPAIKYRHINEYGLQIWEGYFLFNRLMAAHRRGFGTQTSVMKVALGFWLVPFTRTVFTIREIKRHAPQYYGKALRSIPTMLFTQTASALGQLVGVLFGVGHAPEKFLHYSLNIQRRRMDERV